MSICAILLVYTFCSTVVSKDSTHTHQIRVRFSQPPLPLNSYPYQEDLTSTVQFLKEESSNKKNKIETLIKLLKKVLTKYMDVLKENEDNDDHKPHPVEVEEVQALKRELVNENNRTLEKNDKIVYKEYINENEIVEEVKKMHETDDRILDYQKPQDNSHKLNEKIQKIETTIISLEDFVEDDSLNYMRNFRPSYVYYQNQQEPYVLERQEPKNIEIIDPSIENVEKKDQLERNPKILIKNNQRKRLKKQPFYIPCVKASDILNDTPKHVPSEMYCKENSRPKVNSDVTKLQPTLENPVANYITCSDSDDTVAMLFKPKTISLKQAYGNLLKKITVTVLVPFHVTKLVL